MAACRECGRPIVFVRMTTGGKLLPVEAAPDEDGNVVAKRVAGNLHGHVLKKDEEPPHGFTRYLAHYAICAALMSRRRRAPKPLTLFDEPQIDTR